MSLLLLLLLAIQGDETPSHPPPLKVKPAATTPAKPMVAKAPIGANPTITYVPAKPKTDGVAAQAIAAPAVASTNADDTSARSGVSEAARSRLAEEKQADALRRAELRREMTEVQAAIAKSLSAQPLDLAALKAALERRDEVMAKSRSKVTLAVVDLLGDIPAEDRLTVAKALIESDSATQRPAAETKPKTSPVGR